MGEAERDRQREGRDRWKPADGARDRNTRTQSPEDSGRGRRAVVKGEILREAAWTESPGHRGLAALQSRQKPGRQLEKGRASPQPASRPPLSVPSPGRAVHSPPPLGHPLVHCQQSPGHTHSASLTVTRVRPHARLSLARGSWPAREVRQTGDTSTPGTLFPAAAGATATTPLGRLDLQQDGRFPGATGSARILSPSLPVPSTPQTAARAPQRASPRGFLPV